MKTWQVTPLKAVADITLGKMIQPEAKSVSDVEAPYLRAAHVQPLGRMIDPGEQTMWFSPKELRTLDLRRGDVVIVEGGAGYGRTALIERDLEGWGFQNSIVRLRPRPEVASGGFLNYVFQHLLASGETALAASVATIPHFTAEKVAAIRRAMPAAAEQREIADFLDRETAQVDAMIEAQRELVAALDERRLAAVTDLMESVAPISQGKRLKHHLRIVRQGWSPQCHPYPRGGDSEWAVLRVGCVNGGRFDPDDNKALPDDLEPRFDTVIRKDDLIISRANTRDLVGSAAVVLEDYPRLMLSDKLYALSLRSSANPHVVSALLAGSRHRSQIELAASGASHSMQNISLSDIVNLPMDLPTRHDQDRLMTQMREVIARIDAMIEAANESISLMLERRSALISAAVTGRLDPRTGREYPEEDR